MKKRRAIGIIIFACAVILIIRYTQKPVALPLVTLQGTTMGPIPYSVKYLHPDAKSYQAEVDSVLILFNNVLSTYIEESQISRFNNENEVEFDNELFYEVLLKSDEVYTLTDGAFDPTVGPLVNAWGFGPGSEENILDSAFVDSLLLLVGFDRIRFDQQRASKPQDEMYLDFSAIAKGYGVDVVADFLESKGIKNYMVEIGGEVRCKGESSKQKPWLIGIDDPTVDQTSRRLKATVYLENRALATSGNYRNFYIKDGRKISHTISPFTGYPVEHSLLSASVFAPDCMTADALATGFMVLGFEKARAIAMDMPEIDAFLIYADEQGQIQTFATEGIKNFMNVE